MGGGTPATWDGVSGTFAARGVVQYGRRPGRSAPRQDWRLREARGVRLGARERMEAMMAEATFYRCKKCGLVTAVVVEGTCTPQCCGEEMERLEAGSVDAATEKHVPVVTVDEKGMEVAVGEVAHPMTEEHLIEWIAVSGDDKLFIKYLKAGDEPKTRFCKGAAGASTVYAYCNLHGLWKAQI